MEKETGINLQNICISVGFLCVGGVTAPYVENRLAGMKGLSSPVTLWLHLLFVLLFTGIAVKRLRPENAPEDRHTLENGYRLIIALALLAVVGSMTPSPIGFLLSVVVWLFFGLPYRIGAWFWQLDIPLIVRVCLCIADAAAFLCAFCFTENALFKALLLRHKKPAEPPVYVPSDGSQANALPDPDMPGEDD